MTMQQINVLNALDQGALPVVSVAGAPAQGAELYRGPDLSRPSPVHAGLDVLTLEPNATFPIHTHAGHHVLYVIRGSGSVSYQGQVFTTNTGDLIIIPAEVEHNVAAGPEGEVLLAFGAPHRRIDATDRMTVVEAVS